LLIHIANLQAEILCNECGAVILSDVAVEDIEVVMDLMLRMPRDPKEGWHKLG